MLRSLRGYPGASAILPLVTRAAPLAAQALAVVVWATTFVLSAGALATASAAVLTVLRFALAAAVLVPLAVRRGGWQATWQGCSVRR